MTNGDRQHNGILGQITLNNQAYLPLQSPISSDDKNSKSPSNIPQRSQRLTSKVDYQPVPVAIKLQAQIEARAGLVELSAGADVTNTSIPTLQKADTNVPALPLPIVESQAGSKVFVDIVDERQLPDNADRAVQHAEAARLQSTIFKISNQGVLTVPRFQVASIQSEWSLDLIPDCLS
jgi:hypothetical protein